MLIQPTLDKLKALRLGALAQAWQEQQKVPDFHALAFDERLGLLVDAECLYRENKRMDYLLKEAKLKISSASVEGIDFSPVREIDRAVIRQLASCRFITEHQNVTITGMTGTGKTFIACALAHMACRKGFKTLYRRATRLQDELVMAKADGTYHKALARLAKLDLLLIDDWGHAPLKDHERRDFVEIFDDRCGQSATIITSQVPTDNWHDYIADPTAADALCERMLHNAHRLVLKGPSKRKEAAATEQT